MIDTVTLRDVMFEVSRYFIWFVFLRFVMIIFISSVLGGERERAVS